MESVAQIVYNVSMLVVLVIVFALVVNAINFIKKNQTKEASESLVEQKAGCSYEEKSTALAIGLNLVMPGAGYLYMGRAAVGVVVMTIALLAFWYLPLLLVILAWPVPTVLMAIDMVWLNQKRRKASERECPFCAELVKVNAKKCKHCGSELVQEVSE